MINENFDVDELIKKLQPLTDKHAAAFQAVIKECDIRKMKFKKFNKMMNDKVKEMEKCAKI